jgi:FkbM family methyltransferase
VATLASYCRDEMSPHAYGPRALIRVCTSLLRLRVGRPVTRAPLAVGGPFVYVDLRTPLGLGHYRYGNTDPSVDVVRHLLSPGDTFVDGGANVGVFSLFASRAVGPSGRVIAVEAAPCTASLLGRNIALNAASNIEVVQAALGDEVGLANFVVFDAGSGTSSFSPHDTDAGVRMRVPVQTLDYVLHDPPPGRCVVKLDIEGAEVHALRGSQRTLHEVRPDILLEVENDHLRRQGTTSQDLRDLLRDAGYGWCPNPQCAEDVVPLPGDAPWPPAGAVLNILVRPT